MPGVRFRNIQGISIGDNVFLGTDNFFQGAGGITIGNDVQLGPGVKIWSMNHKYQDIDILIRSQGYDLKAVHIGDDVWIGANVIILPGAKIGNGCVIAAGSVVTDKTIPEYTVVAGNPCRKIGTRERSAERATVGQHSPPNTASGVLAEEAHQQ